MLRDAAKRFLADTCSTKFVRQMMADESGHDPGFWRKLVDLGWPGLLIPEEYGGQGGTFLDMTVIAEEAGKALVPGPFFAAALLGAPFVIDGGSDAQKKELLPKMAKGEYIATVAIAEAAGRFDAGGIELKAGKKGADYTLSNPEDAAKTVAHYFRKTPEEVLAGMKPLKFFGTKGWQEHMKLHTAQMQYLAQWLYDNKKIPSVPDVAKWENTSFLPK